MRRVSVVIVGYNSAEVLPACVGAISRHLQADEVVVVDNASSDATVAVAQSLGCEVVRHQRNVGYGLAANAGVQRARNDLVALVNPDVELIGVDTWQLAREASIRPLGLLAPRRLETLATGWERGGRASLPWPLQVIREAVGTAVPAELSGRTAPAGIHRKPGWLHGALLVLSRGEFLSVGGFADNFFLYYEDQELSARYRARGLPVRLTDAIAARHGRGASSAEERRARAVPRAASALSSIEFVGVRHGQRRLRMAWTMYWTLRRMVRVLCVVAARAERAQRKLREIESTHAAIEDLLGRGGPHYPAVKALLAYPRQGPRRYRERMT
jgi:GT2 family glycosyltransferase